MKRFALSCILLIGWLTSPAQQKKYNILDYGAVADSSHNSTLAIQQAIDSCSASGGGSVIVPKGAFSSSTIYLKSDITLVLEKDAELYAVPDAHLYKNVKAGIENTGDAFVAGLVVALNANHIAIKGPGKIIGLPHFREVPVLFDDDFPGWNANARASGVVMKAVAVEQPKISLIYISGCEDVQLEDVQVINSPNWSCHIQWSRNIRVHHITILSSLEKGVNSDGLDIDGCNQVEISECTIRTGDDAICLKSTRQNGRSEKCEHILVRDCQLSSSSCALKIGTESYSDFNHIVFTHCEITETNRGMGIFIRDGAAVNNVEFSDIRMHCGRKPFFWWGDGDAFQFIILKRNPKSRVGSVSNLILKNIEGIVQGGSLIQGLGDSSMTHIRLENIRLVQHAESQPDKRAKHALAIQNARDVVLHKIKLERNASVKEMKWTSLFLVSDVHGFSLSDFKNNQQKINPSYPALQKENVTEELPAR